MLRIPSTWPWHGSLAGNERISSFSQPSPARTLTYHQGVLLLRHPSRGSIPPDGSRRAFFVRRAAFDVEVGEVPPAWGAFRDFAIDRRSEMPGDAGLRQGPTSDSGRCLRDRWSPDPAQACRKVARMEPGSEAKDGRRCRDRLRWLQLRERRGRVFVYSRLDGRSRSRCKFGDRLHHLGHRLDQLADAGLLGPAVVGERGAFLLVGPGPPPRPPGSACAVRLQLAGKPRRAGGWLACHPIGPRSVNCPNWKVDVGVGSSRPTGSSW